MTDRAENLVLAHMRAIRADLAALRRDVRTRLTAAEADIAMLRHARRADLTALDHQAQDHLEQRFDRIEQCLAALEAKSRRQP